MADAAVVVDVWSSRPVVGLSSRERGVLDGVERARAAALPGHAADRFVLGRVLLRNALAARMGCGPEDVVLRARCPRCGGPHGSVVVLPGGPLPCAAAPLHVSVTRAGPVVAVAVCDSGRVGIDVEATVAVAAAPLADVALSPAELAARRRLPRRARARWLARAWVRKEAALKALGTGLDVDPASVELRSPPSRLPGVDAVLGDTVAVADLVLGDDAVGAVALVCPNLVGPGTVATGAPSRRLLIRRYDGASILSGRRS